MNTEDELIKQMREALRYEPTTGVVKWSACGPKKMANKTAGNKRKDGYSDIKFQNKAYLKHRIIWALVYGRLPATFLDHINGNRSDNRIVNLREVTKTSNNQNQRRPHKNNKIGLLGVSKNLHRWSARIQISGTQIFLGNFDTPELAHEAYLIAKRKHHESCTI